MQCSYMIIDCIVYYRMNGSTPLQEAVNNKISAAVWTYINEYKVDTSQYDEVKYLS